MRDDIRIIRSRRKTVSIRIDENLRITVRAPLRMPDGAIRFIRAAIFAAIVLPPSIW